MNSIPASGMDDDAKNERIRSLREKQHEIRMRALERWYAALDALAD